MTRSKSDIPKLNFDTQIPPERTVIPRKMTCCHLLLRHQLFSPLKEVAYNEDSQSEPLSRFYKSESYL